MGGSRALLAGKPLFGALTWALTSGVRPFQTVVYMSHADADALTGAGGTAGSTKPTPVELTLEAGIPARSHTFKGVYVLHRVASPLPWFAAVLISDRRWLWSKRIFRRYANIRRKVGTKRLTSPNQLDALNLEPRLVYAPWSLKGGTQPWTASALLKDLGDELVDVERQEAGAEPSITVPDVTDLEQTPIQDLELEGSLDECVERALASIPGMDVTVDADGGVRFFKRADASEMEEVRKAGQETQAGGHIEVVSYARTRARKFRIYFSLECEVRVNFTEEADAGATSALDVTTTITCDNVLPIPDAALPVGGRTLYTGTYITVGEAFTAWGALPVYGKPLSFRLVRRASVPFNGIWQMAHLAGQASPDQDWPSRIAAVMTHFRRTYRIARVWMDRFFEIRAYRVATINPETGTRGDATVWQDFAWLASGRSMYAESANDQTISYAMNVAGYPAGGVLGPDSTAAPATLRVEDSDQGVFSVTLNGNPTRFYEAALPSQVETEGANTQPGTLVAAGQGGPSPYIRRSTRGIAWNVLGRFQNPAALTANHKMIAILTAIPACPNSKRALCYVDVSPNDPDVPDFPGKGRCDGPVQEVRISPTLEVARVAWLDSAKDRILGIFNEDASQRVSDGPYPLADLVVNYEGNVAGGASLRGIAVAEAARQWQAQRDRAVGGATFGFRGVARLVGAMTSIQHTLDTRGVLLTRYDLPGRIEPLSIARYFSAGLRKILFRLVNPGR